jgi:CheY-like chemotaxis protein
LVVNADPAWRRMTRALLEGGGFRVTEAVDAVQAMQLMGAGEEFALMVTDLMMPSITTPQIAPQRTPSLRPTTAVPVVQIPETPARRSGPVQIPAQTTDNNQNVDWARFAATVQSSIRRTEH